MTSRLALLQRYRLRLAAERDDLLHHLGKLRPGASRGELISSELIPLLDNIAFLVSEAPGILAPRRLGRRGQPIWLLGVDTTVYREPLGRVLIVAPSNYPLFLPMVCAVYAWAAGNSVSIKPAPGSFALHKTLQGVFRSVGGEAEAFRVLPEETEEVARALQGRQVDKVVLVGSAQTGKTVLAQAGAALVPTVAELSGWDSVFVHPQADLKLVADSLAWALALNGGRTCVAPRRIFFRGRVEEFENLLSEALEVRGRSPLSQTEQELLESHPGRVLQAAPGVGPAVLSRVDEGHALLREPHFGGLAVLHVVEDDREALVRAKQCPYALGCALFGPDEWCHEMARKVPAQVVCLNDVLVPTADPRVPFGGSGHSGWGRMRGAEGLLEMTQTRTICHRRGGNRDHLLPPSPSDDTILEQFLLIGHGQGVKQRLLATARMVVAIARERIRKKRAQRSLPSR